jgi:acyl dehydratase
VAAQTLSFQDAPDLTRLFAAAVVNGRHTGTSLPSLIAERRGVVVDPSVVVDYAHVCRFTVGAHPPATWPHLLAFPLQAVLMSRRDFPLPMVGLVHVENRIIWARPLDYGEHLDVRVQAADLRPHRRGRLVDLVAELVPTGTNQVVWRGVSTYLARGSGDETASDEKPPGVTALRSAGGGVVWHIDEGAGRAYASVSGDVNPIHLHALTARAFGFPRAIAHGMYMYARVLASLAARVPDAGTSTVCFRKPVLLPSTVRLAVAGDAHTAVVFPAKGEGEHLVVTLTPGSLERPDPDFAVPLRAEGPDPR